MRCVRNEDRTFYLQVRARRRRRPGPIKLVHNERLLCEEGRIGARASFYPGIY